MNTAELECILSRAMDGSSNDDDDSGSSCRFLGVFAADQAPVRLAASDYPCAYVVNTDPASMPGQHWVAFYAQSPRHLEFFDSYGRHPSAYVHVRAPANCASFIMYNPHSFQSLRSVVCGHYCVLYLVMRAVAREPRLTILHMLRRYSAENGRRGSPYPQDRLVRRFVRSFVSRLHISNCVSERHRCGGGQCCRARSLCAQEP